MCADGKSPGGNRADESALARRSEASQEADEDTEGALLGLWCWTVKSATLL